MRGCQVNGVFLQAWQAHIPQNSDDITLFLATEEPITAALFGTAFALGFWGGIVSAAITVAIVTAVSIGLQYAIRALTPTPSNTAGKTEQVFGIAGVTNTTSQGTPKFFSYGTRRIFGHIIDTRVSVAGDGKTTNFGILYYMGEGPIQGMSAFEINDTPLDQFPNTQAYVRLGDGNVDLIPGFDTISSVWTDGRTLALATPIVYATRGDQVERATLILATPLLFRVADNGRHIHGQHTLHIEFTTVTDASYEDAPGSPFVWADGAESTRFTTFPLQFDHADAWLIRVTLTAVLNQSDTPPILYNVQEEESGARHYPTDALLAFTGIANAQITSFEQMRGSALVQGLVVRQPLRVAGAWDGVTYVNAWTNNRAWVLRDFLTHPRYGFGNRIVEDLWDDHAAVAAANYWEEFGFAAIPRDRCDVLINDRRAGWDWIKMLLTEGRALLIPSGGLLKVVVDKADSAGLQYSSPGNIIEGSVMATLGDGQGLIPNTIRGQFQDEDANFLTQIAQYPVEDVTDEPIRETLVTISSLTNIAQVHWLLRYQLLRSQLVQRHFAWQSPRTALVSEPLDRVSFAYETASLARGVSGFLATGSTTTRLLLDRLVTLEDGQTYALIVSHQADNTVERKILDTGAGVWGAVAPTVALATTPDEGDLWALGIQNVAIVPLVIETVEQSSDGNYAVTASRYEASIHDTPEPPSSPGVGARLVTRPLPLWAVSVTEEVQFTNDGTAQTQLLFAVTPQLQSHAGTCRNGFSTVTTVQLTVNEPTPLDLEDLAGTLDGFYLGGAVFTATAGTGIGQVRTITGYLGDTQTISVSPAWGVTPDATTEYVIGWPVFNDTTGFFVEQATLDGDGDINSPFVPLATFQGLNGAITAPTGETSWAVRFTPTNATGVPNHNARWIMLLTTHGDQEAPDAPSDSSSGEEGTSGSAGDAASTDSDGGFE